ncbi:group 1 truncated hemoglobin [Mitsuaria sp. WAJ17]|uniref:group I truncated hemoglobin n=1 Tax=Mitsuaria sp. WAJ17 TaxID=2761452 RepID=UPI0016010C8B|nr:group 1 truncated hemoglobin [Mitsuaria sp. WAJ17]MBB2486731.1 group 1 truncated hemoglobin [Mitsuaria sp. WAJ17]
MKAPALLAPLAVALLCALGGARSAHADDSLYSQLGGKPALELVVDGLLQRATQDARIKDFFKETNLKYLRTQLVDQLCAVTGGPCRYEGETMANAHAAMGLSQAHFNALVEDLQDAMDAAGLPFATQGRLLALLAPMHRDIVTR